MCQSDMEKIITIIEKIPNLSIFLGSGASRNLMPDMSTLLTAIKQISKIDSGLLKNDIKKFNNNINNLEEYLTQIMVLKLYYKNDIEITKTIDNLINKIKNCIFTELNIIENCQNKIDDKNETIENYNNMYLALVMHRSLIHNYLPINIFTTNYDLLNEYSMDILGLNYTTGFKGDYKSEFYSESFKLKLINETDMFKKNIEDSIIQFRLYKLHGSLNWIEENNKVIKESLNNIKGSSICLLPTFDKSRNVLSPPFFILFSSFINILNKQNMVFFIFGYGFQDIHINEYLENALKINNSLRIYIMINNEQEEDKNIKRILKYTNVIKLKEKTFGCFWKNINEKIRNYDRNILNNKDKNLEKENKINAQN